MEIIPYHSTYQDQLIQLILGIQQKEFAIAISLEEQPDLLHIAEHYAGFWLAVKDGQILGCIGLIALENGKAALKKMFVREDYRKHGLGRLLVNQLVTACEQKGFREIFLGTKQVFVSAQHFYQNYGFEKINKIDLPDDFPLLEVDDTFYRFRV